jgi:hypothetical protein
LAYNVSSANGSYIFRNSTRASLVIGKIDPLTLLAAFGTLIVVWTMAVVGLWLTIKREYLHTFSSTQTGCSFSRGFVLGNEGNDAKRIRIFEFNERLWRSIRECVRQWALSMYATWEALKPTWFTDARKAAIPDDFIPGEALQNEIARAPSGRRPSVAEMGVLRRLSLANGGTDSETEAASD